MNTCFKYDHYYAYDELKSNLEQLQKQYPDLMDLDVNCVTLENRNQYVVTLTNKNTGQAKDKPAFYIDGNIHAGEVTASMAAMHTIDYLLTNYQSDNTVKKILDNNTIYIIPRVTPDGAETYLTTPYSLRSVNREYNFEEGGIEDKDLNDDGMISMMAIPSKYGSWIIDKDGNTKLRSPSDNEGDFYDIYPEGVLNEYEGSENLKRQKNKWGLDYNRNFPYGWYPENKTQGAGDYPLSNIETKAVADFVLKHDNICGAVIGHTSGGLLLYPPGTRASSKAPWLDLKILKDIAKMGEEETGYKPLNIFDSFISDPENVDSGALDDWMFETQGIPSYTVEFWDLASKAGVPVDWTDRQFNPEKQLERFNATIKWVKENAPQYYMDWKDFIQAPFGPVKLGGFNFKFTHQNPPESFLLKELEANTKFNIRFIKALPKLIIEGISCEKLNDNTYKINVVVGNTGYLSTALTQTCKDIKKNKPIKVSLDGAEIFDGKKEIEIEELEGYSSTSTGVFYYGNISTSANAKSRKRLSWLINAKQGDEITINISHNKAGKNKKTFIIR